MEASWLFSFLLIFFINSFHAMENSWQYFYVGTYTNGESKGIYLYKMNSVTGELQYINVTGGVQNPSFLVIDKTKDYLYSVNELTEFKGRETGTVSAFIINKDDKSLKYINSAITNGGAPCHLIIDASNNFLLAANYVGGNACVFKINGNGGLGEMTGFVQHKGNGPNTNRQEAPHAHSVNLDPQNKFLYVADLGIDKVMIYRFNSESGSISTNEPPYLEVTPGAGPRHFTFHPNNKYTFLINELNSTITSFKYDNQNGSLTEINTESTLPYNFDDENYCADIHVHPNGKFLYGSNRGHNSVAIFKIDEATGKIILIGLESTRGIWPRNFAIDPGGKFLLVANQISNDVFVFEIDEESGLLNYTGHSAQIPSPVCLIFY